LCGHVFGSLPGPDFITFMLENCLIIDF
jgi:hypothetical protein